MDINTIIDYLVISIIASTTVNVWIRNIAKNNSILIDLPDKSRKFHKRATPLTGGISILFAILIAGKLYIDLYELSEFMPNFSLQLIYASVILVACFLIDDARGLTPMIRLLIQAALTLYVIKSTGVELNSLGNLFGNGELLLGKYSTLFTVFAVIGLMNAFNMLDGINGLCSGFSMLFLLMAGFYSGFIYDSMLVIVIGAIIGFLFFNLRVFGAKRGVFLGDHGSNLMGFWVAWAAIYISQNAVYNTSPMTMVWMVSIPLLDCLGLILSRSSKGVSWATPGRDHIHHKLMDYFSPEGTLFVILIIASLINFISFLLESWLPEFYSFYLFIVFSLFYYFITYKLIYKKE